MYLPIAHAAGDCWIRPKEEGIQTSIHYSAIHHFSAFRSMYPNLSLPITEAFASRELTLPLYPCLSEARVDTIVSSVLYSYPAAKRLHEAQARAERERDSAHETSHNARSSNL
jgi:hypothetical protein